MEDFELWLYHNRNLLTEEAFDLFADSLRCSKMNIDRAAYLLAYQGMMVTLKNAILRGTRPAGFSEPEWNGYLAGINDDFHWDENTYDRAVQQPNPGAGRPAVLCMPREVRDEFPHWRRLRNTCAHYKRAPMQKAHTITLYSFIRHYLMNISVEGGMYSLLNEIDEHYDPSRTRPDTDVTPVIAKVQTMVRPDEITLFIREVRKIIGKYHSFSDRFFKFLHFARLSGNADLANEVVKYIKVDTEFECRYIDTFPEEVHVLLDTDAKTRKYWHELLQYSMNKHTVLAELLATGKIPPQDRNDAYNRILSYMYQHNEPMGNIDDVHLRVLKANGYFRCFAENYYVETYTSRNDKVREICYKTDFYMSHLNLMDIDDDFVRRSIAIYGAVACPYTLLARFNGEFLTIVDKRDKFEEVRQRLGINVPASLTL